MYITCTKGFATVTANFDDTKDFEGWNCGQITSCGKYGNVCGGYDTKAKGDDIKKTFDVPDGKYSVTLDFIRIDSWFVWHMQACFDLARLWVVFIW